MWTILRLALAAGLTIGSLAVPAAAASVYGGHTSQAAGGYGAQRLPGNDVSFIRSRGAVRSFSIPWVAECRSEAPEPPLLERTLILDPLPVRDGRFTATGSYAFVPGRRQMANVEPFTVQGKFFGNRASGTLTVSSSVKSDDGLATDYCDTQIRWTATAGRRPVRVASPARRRPLSRAPGVITWARTDRATLTSAIWLTATAGRHQSAITQPAAGASDRSPGLAVDQRLLAYERTDAEGTQIHVGDPFEPSYVPPTSLGGGRITAFAQGARDPSIAEDGRIVFTVGSGADCALWISLGDGSGQRQLTDHGGRPGCDEAPAWSPTGARVAFRRTFLGEDGATSVQHMVVAAAGGTPRALSLGGAAPVSFSWAPGSRLVLLTAGGEATPSRLEVVGPDGRGLRTVLSDPGLEGTPVWSPTGHDIAVVQRQADETTDIVAVPATGGLPFNITETPGVSEEDPTWSRPELVLQSVVPGHGVHARSHRPRKHGRRPRPDAR